MIKKETSSPYLQLQILYEEIDFHNKVWWLGINFIPQAPISHGDSWGSTFRLESLCGK